MSGLDLKNIFRESLHAISPIAMERKIAIRLDKPEEPVYTTLPLDEGLGPVFYLLLRLMYFLPKNRALKLQDLKRFDSCFVSQYLQLEIRVFSMPVTY